MATRAILFDLDDTLLSNDPQAFIPAYVEGLSARLTSVPDVRRYLSSEAPEGGLGAVMFSVLEDVAKRSDRSDTNMVAFLESLASRLACAVDELAQAYGDYHAEDLPALKSMTTAKPEARELVTHLIDERGLPVVVATDPFYSRSAIEQRLSWAGLDGLAFARVTTGDDCHFKKPDKEYYEGILDELGIPASRTWMVGDSPDLDIAPARDLGMRTFWIRAGRPGITTAPDCEASGTLSDFRDGVLNGRFL